MSLPELLSLGGGDAAFCWACAFAPGPGTGPLQVKQRPLEGHHNVLQPNPAKPHPIISGIVDFFTLAILLGTMVALVSAVLQKPLKTSLLLLLLCGSILLTATYHFCISRRVLWLSPGELFAGRRVVQTHKEWVNPMHANRTAFFIVGIVCLVLMGSAWDGLSQGQVYPIGTVLLRGMLLSVSLGGIVAAGRGVLWAGVLTALYFAISALQHANHSPREVSVFFTIVAALVTSTVYAYSKRRALAVARREAKL